MGYATLGLSRAIYELVKISEVEKLNCSTKASGLEIHRHLNPFRIEYIMKLELLADNPDSSKPIARWYFDEWAGSGVELGDVENSVSAYCERNCAPLLVLAQEGNKLLGAAQLKIREMKRYPEFEFWLGGVYVEENSRGRGVGKALTLDIIRRAKKAGVGKLYLQTESLTGGMYVECGFRAVEQVENKGRQVLVMTIDLNHGI